MANLKDKTLFITGATRGIGLAIATRAAKDGANIVVVAKTTEPNPKLPGTIYTAVEAIEAAGGKGLAIPTDIRSEEQVKAAIEQTVSHFGGIDILVNNASAINLSGTLDLDMKRYDLMHQVNGRGSFLCSKLCIPELQKADNPHVLSISPPMDWDLRWFKNHPGYTLAKYSMSVYAWAMAAEFADSGIAFNCLWPRTPIATAAIQNLMGGGDDLMKLSRTPNIMGDAAHAILTRPARECTGQFFIDDIVLQETGVSDFDQYKYDPATKNLAVDFFVPDDTPPMDGVISFFPE